MILIAEIGNNHFGSMYRAKELIRAAVDSGADLVKGQAFGPDTNITGTMPLDFYHQCMFREEQYIELILYAKELGAEMFYSVFSKKLDALDICMNHHKIAASQFEKLSRKKKEDLDQENYFISVSDMGYCPRFKKATVLYATKYGERGSYRDMNAISTTIEKQVGLSDHGSGISFSINAHRRFGLPVIERHFTLEKKMKYLNIIFRDTIFGLLPGQFYNLKKELDK